MTGRVVVLGSRADRALAGMDPEGPEGLIRSGNPCGHDLIGRATEVVVALGTAAFPAGAEVTLVRWLAGVAGPERADEERVIAQGGVGLWRRAPWPVSDALFSLPPPPAVPRALVVGSDERRSSAVAVALQVRGVAAEASHRLGLAALVRASVVVCQLIRGAPVPAWLMAPLSARRVLVLVVGPPDFGLQAGVDHLSAGDDDEAVALAAAVAARPDAFRELVFFGRLAAERHRASGVYARLLTDLEFERRVGHD